MKKRTQQKIRTHFKRAANAIFWPSEITRIVADHQRDWDFSNVSLAEATKCLLDEGILTKAEFISPNYPLIVRYIRGNPSPHALAVSLRRQSFLCHGTALALHGLVQPSEPTLYVNQEQAPKGEPGAIIQSAINRAFKSQQRRSNYIFEYQSTRYVLLNGKDTGQAGVTQMKAPSGEVVNCTDLERTLIDVVVRPAYAGGIQQVFAAYKKAVHKVDVQYMIKLLEELAHAYPYHQSIGFLLARAGRPEKDCDKFKQLGTDFDFFLDYGLKQPEYDEKWRLYHPPFPK